MGSAGHRGHLPQPRSAQLKRLARRFQIAIIVVAHPTKEGGKAGSIEDATLYDINGGAVWNNKADLGVIVWAD